MLKKLPREEGPYELEINKLFSKEPLASDPRNHCVRLLDIIELPDDPPIIVHPLLRPFSDPHLQTYGEFVTFFSHVCEVSFVSFEPYHVAVQLSTVGCPIHAREPRRSQVCRHRPHIPFLIWSTLGIVRTGTSCSTRQICSPSLSTPL